MASVPNITQGLNVSTPLNFTPEEFDTTRLQEYIQQQTQTIMTKPGYEVFFYSRFDTDSSLGNEIFNGQSTTLNQPTNTLTTLQSVVPTAYLTSDVEPGQVPNITAIIIHNRVQTEQGCAAILEMIEPPGVTYFQPTIGNTTVSTSYDASFGLNKTQHRIGTMDTVVIRLKNPGQQGKFIGNTYTETVFRGVVGNIRRKRSVTGGSIITLQLYDFSEWLRRISALPIGFFSTISFSFTGRGLTNNLLQYTNRLYSGNWNFAGINLTSQVQSIINNVLQISLQNNQIDTTSLGGNPNHAMDIPPFLYLEFSGPPYNLPDNPFSATMGYPNNSANSNNFSQTLLQDAQQIASVVANSVNFTKLASDSAFNPYKLTVEDTESVETYRKFIDSQHIPTDVGMSDATQASVNGLQNAEQNAWILSDLYLEKGLITFEHEIPWNTIYNAADRSMREVYFDFAPKLNPHPINAYHTALATDVKSSWQLNQPLPDIHPNIGILKYRLSPCFIPYNSSYGTIPSASNFYFWEITDDQIIEYDSEESEERVFTSVFGFGTALDSADITQFAQSIAAGQNKGLFATAKSIDPRIERRIGYRFMTDHDEKITIPILMYLTSYVLLQKSQLSMFQQTIKIIGNPRIQPGTIIRLASQNADYYCVGAVHTWSLKGGYVTELDLAYGHTSGVAPSSITGVGVLQNQQAQNLACQLKASALSGYVSQSEMIGNVNLLCFTSAIWQYMTGGATTFSASGNEGPSGADWITPWNWTTSTMEKYGSGSGFFGSTPTGFVSQPIGYRDSEIIAGIQQIGLNQYNVTTNLIKNIIQQESNWYANIINSIGAIGWFQLYGHQNEISNQDAVTYFSIAPTGHAAALPIALGVLKSGFVADNIQPGTTGAAWLQSIGAHYGGNPNWQEYVTQILGATQVSNIISGTQTPNNAGGTGNQQQQWPYKVYGPCGLQISEGKIVLGNVTDQSVIYNLNQFKTGMTTSVKYFRYILNKYQTASISSLGQVFYNVNDSSLLQKAIAAWYSGESPNNVNAGLLNNVINQVTSLYNECLNCTTANPSTYNPTDPSELNAVLSNVKFICPIQNPQITSPYGPRVAPVPGASSFHPGIDLVNTQGTPGTSIYAAAAGTILYAGGSSNAGTIISIYHGNGIGTRYIDLGSAAVTQGQQVQQGQVIGNLGQTIAPGVLETGLHLHWEIRTGVTNTAGSDFYGVGTTHDPAAVLSQQGNPIG